MARYDTKKICEIIDEIDNDEVILPAIQRDFVWSENKVCDLFDSLLRDYPIGTFLFWEIKKENVTSMVCNKFLTVFDERRGKNQRGARLVNPSLSKYIGVLDGQQRITSIYLGVKGSYQTKIVGRKKSDPNAYEDRFLCMNILHDPKIKHDTSNVFAFKLNGDTKVVQKDDASNRSFWVKVSEIYQFGKDVSVSKIIRDIEYSFFESGWPIGEREHAEKNIENLRAMLFDRENINYYTTKDPDLSSVVDIFVKVNSGGENLSAADLMLSVGAETSPDKDLHIMLVDAAADLAQVAEVPSFIDNNYILTAGLLFTGAESVSPRAKDSYSPIRMNQILDHWDEIISALKYTIIFLQFSGINVAKIPKSIYLTVAYYFYRKPDFAKPGTEQSGKSQYSKDRILIRQYVLRGIFTGLFDSSTGNVLLAVRRLIDEAINTKKKYFPLDSLMTNLGDRKLTITSDVLDKIMDITYSDAKVEPLLREIRGDRSVTRMHVDHIWPKTNMESPRKFKAIHSKDDDYKKYHDARHNLANLQLLTINDNESKGEQLFDAWIEDNPQDDQYYKINCIPKKDDGTMYSFEEYFDFLDARSVLLKQAIQEALPENFNTIAEKYQFNN